MKFLRSHLLVLQVVLGDLLVKVVIVVLLGLVFVLEDHRLLDLLTFLLNWQNDGLGVQNTLVR